MNVPIQLTTVARRPVSSLGGHIWGCGGFYTRFAIPLYPDQVHLLPWGVSIKAFGRDDLTVDTDDKPPFKIGILADVHQNSLLLSETLDVFEKQSVRLLFALGDYCYTVDPDADGKRSRQVRVTLELINAWLSRDNRRKAVILLGNHEMEPHYFAHPDTLEEMKRVIGEWSTIERMHFQREPFRSFQMDNAVMVTVMFGDQNRTFRLSHAITQVFVNALYRGLDKSRLAEDSAKVESSLGLAWLGLQVSRQPAVASRWSRFLAAAQGSVERGTLIHDITSDLRKQMNVTSVVEEIGRLAGPFSGDAEIYGEMISDLAASKAGVRSFLLSSDKEELYSLFAPPQTRDPPEALSWAFSAELRRLFSSLGAGSDYSICGHFHADLGMFELSSEFGSYMIGVGGFQPGKLIADHFSAYILELNYDYDVLVCLSSPDDPTRDPESWDLSE